MAVYRIFFIKTNSPPDAIYVAPIPWLLRIKQQQLWLCRDLCGTLTLDALGTYPTGLELGHLVVLFLHFWGTSTLTFQVYIPTSSEYLPSLYPCLNLLSFPLLMTSHSDSGEMGSQSNWDISVLILRWSVWKNFSVFNNKRSFSQAIASLWLQNTESHKNPVFPLWHLWLFILSSWLYWEAAGRLVQHTSSCVCEDIFQRGLTKKENHTLCGGSAILYIAGWGAIRDGGGSYQLKHPVSASCLPTGEPLCSTTCSMPWWSAKTWPQK